MGVNKIAISISIGLLALVAAIYFFADYAETPDFEYSREVTIDQVWELPKILSEISAIAFQGGEKVVAVQDEQGKLFVYNLGTSQMEKEINFSGTGDYEGLALDGSTAYVLRSDGTIFEIKNYLQEPKVKEFPTFLTEQEDTEGLCLDKKNNRLLIAIKADDPSSETSKGIYSFSLANMEMEKEPIFEIDLENDLFSAVKGEDLQDVIKPSEVVIHPQTGQIYVLEGQDPKLLVLEATGEISELYMLDKDNFPQPEGLTFDDDGKMYISSEGSPGRIYRVSLK